MAATDFDLDLKMGVMLASFQSPGTVPSDMHLLKMLVRGILRMSAMSCSTRGLILSGPGAELVFRFRNFFLTNVSVISMSVSDS